MKTIVVRCAVVLVALWGCALAPAQSSDQWAQWRGPFSNGMARGDAPTNWSDTTNIKWKAQIPGRGHSTPIIWGDKIFLTTAIPTGKPGATPTNPEPPTSPQGGGRGGAVAGPQVEHRFELLCLDRQTGKLLWQRTAKVATPHEGYHRVYGSFA